MYTNFKNFLIKISSVDLRSLALLRIYIGLLLIADLLNRSTDLIAHYTDFGVLPRPDYMDGHMNPWYISLHVISGRWEIEALLFAIAIFFAFLLIVGYKTRLVTFISWFLLISVQLRNPMVLNGGDQVFRMILFFSMFMPLGAKFSIDALRSKTKAHLSNTFSSLATFGYIFQIGSLYVFSVFFKTSPEWRTDGTAIYYALSIDHFATPLAQFMLQFPFILKIQTYMVFWLEALAPFLLLIPLGLIRTLVVFIFISLHIGMGIHLELSFFPWICSAAWIGILPTWFWDTLLPKFKIDQLFQKVINKIKKIPNNAVYVINYLKNKDIGYELSTDLKWYKSPLIALIMLFATLYIFLWNVSTLSSNPNIMPNQLKWIAGITYVQQKWGLFSPSPGKTGMWIIIPATLKDGSQVDLYTNGGEIKWEKPELVSATYKNGRWQKYLTNIANPTNKYHAELYANYLCRNWNRIHTEDKKVESFFIIFNREFTQPNYEYSQPSPMLVVNKKC